MRYFHIGSFAVAGRARSLKLNGYRSSPLIRNQLHIYNLESDEHHENPHHVHIQHRLGTS